MAYLRDVIVWAIPLVLFLDAFHSSLNYSLQALETPLDGE